MVSLTHSCFVFCWCNSRSCCYLFILFSSRPHYTSTLIGRSPPPPGALCASRLSHPTLLRGTPRESKESEWHEIQHRYLGGASYSLHSAPSQDLSHSRGSYFARSKFKYTCRTWWGLCICFFAAARREERRFELLCAIEKRSTREREMSAIFSRRADTRERSIKGRGKTMVLQSAKLLSFLTSDRWVITACMKV